MGKKEILETLNEQQRLPVIDYHGPSIVIAAAGSGKTHMLVSRASYMIEDGIDPRNILSDFSDSRRVVQLIGRMLKSQIEKLLLCQQQFFSQSRLVFRIQLLYIILSLHFDTPPSRSAFETILHLQGSL